MADDREQRRRARRERLASDPTLVRNQPALRTSSGTEWLVVGLVLGAVSVAVLLLQHVRAADVAAAVVATLVGAMLVVRLAVRPLRTRLLVLAGLLVAVPVVTLVVLLGLVAS
jgi:hypothetical protein